MCGILLSICFQIRKTVKPEAILHRKVAQEQVRTITEWFITGILHSVTAKCDCQSRLVNSVFCIFREKTRDEKNCFDQIRRILVKLHFIILDNFSSSEGSLLENQVELAFPSFKHTPGGEAVTKFRHTDYPLIRLDDSYRPSRTCEMDLSINSQRDIRWKSGREILCESIKMENTMG